MTGHTTTDVDVLIVGAGITGIYQLYRARAAGFSCLLVEAGGGVGGTWFWNRYPGCRFDSESYTYGYLFSEELFDEWEWSEHFASQPETELYLNHVVDRFDLRRDMLLGVRVTGAVYDETTATWVVTTDDGAAQRCRFLIAATGVLSVPYTPDVPGRDSFLGVQHHTGLWPEEPVDFRDKYVAIVGTSSSGVQVLPAILPEVASVAVYQRTANWCTPLNNRPITAEEQAKLRAGFAELCEVLRTSRSGFAHPVNERDASDDTPEQRRALYERLWNSPGFTKLTSNYQDLLTDEDTDSEWCAFIAEKIRGIVHDPGVAERLIPRDHGYGGKRPPFVSGYYEAFNDPKVALVDLRETPILQVTPTGIETSAGAREFDVIVWATGFDFGTGALTRMGIRGREGLALEEHWTHGPTTFMGLQTGGFPNFFFPGGPHAAAGNNPRYNGDQVDFLTDLLVEARARGCEVVEVADIAEERWTRMVDRFAATTSFGKDGQYDGGNIPGKTRRYLLNAGGRHMLFKVMDDVRANGYADFGLGKAGGSVVTVPPEPGGHREPTRSGMHVSLVDVAALSRPRGEHHDGEH